MRVRLLFVLLVFSAAFIPPYTHVAHAQVSAPCGIVDAIDYPIDSVVFDRDDFGLYRSPFGGRHTGIDMAFGRYGDPVKAAARGRVTLADPKAWDTEKGVVIIEHVMPDDSIMYSLYGHMESNNGHPFPAVGQCVALGEVIGSVGHPSRGAPHLHYEIRGQEASSGGPGYSYTEPLDGGWTNPIDFTERWQLRLHPAFRSMIVASGPPTARPVFLPDGSAIFAAENQLVRRTTSGETLWRLDISRLVGIVSLSDGRVLGRTADDQVIVVSNGNFSAYWKADRALETPPLPVGDSVVFVGADQRAVSYTPDGSVIWQAGPFGDHLEKAVVSGSLVALSTGRAGTFQLYVLNAEGRIVFQAAAASPVIPSAAKSGGFYIMVGPQVGYLDPNGRWAPYLDVGQPLGRQAQIAVDPHGNTYLYPGNGRKLIALGSDGKQRWATDLPVGQLQPPLIDVGGGCLVYVLSGDGALGAYQTSDGKLRGRTALYPGGALVHADARWMTVDTKDQVQFSAGYLTVASLDGFTLAGLNACDTP